MAFVLLCLAVAAQADSLRIATYHASFSRDGPGLLLRDFLRDPADFDTILTPIAGVAPDVLVLTNIDYDADHAALGAVQQALAQRGIDFSYRFALRPNGGMATGFDLDGDGRTNGARDAQGYGRFAGQGGMAILSNTPILVDQVRDLSGLLWSDLPENRRNPDDPAPEVQRLSSNGHWIVPLDTAPTISLLVYHATPPVFDGPEDRNGRRNADETALWQRVLDKALSVSPPDHFILVGNANLDPARGEGLRTAMQALLTDVRLTDPSPTGPYGTATADWPEPSPGRLRVSYVLPSATLKTLGSAVHWVDGDPVHKLVWLDVQLPP